MRKGFALPLILVIVLLLGLATCVGLKKYGIENFLHNRPKGSDFIPPPTTTPPNNLETTNWKTYTSNDNLYEIKYPGEWAVNGEKDISLGKGKIDIDIITWEDGSTEYVEEQWSSGKCGVGEDGFTGTGCVLVQPKESKKLNISGNTVYWKIDGDGQMHAFVPNKSKNKTVEIYSDYLQDKEIFKKIVSTFKFLE